MLSRLCVAHAHMCCLCPAGSRVGAHGCNTVFGTLIKYVVCGRLFVFVYECVCVMSPAGIDRSRVEAMEARLKADVLREAARYEHHILVTEEDDDMNVSETHGS